MNATPIDGDARLMPNRAVHSMIDAFNKAAGEAACELAWWTHYYTSNQHLRNSTGHEHKEIKYQALTAKDHHADTLS
jgi:hypothetical protein